MSETHPQMECRLILGTKPVFAFVGLLICLGVAFVLPRVIGILGGGLTCAAFVVWFINDARTRLVIDNAGIAIRRPLGGSAMTWDEVAYYRLWSQTHDENANVSGASVGGALGGVLGAIVVGAIEAAMAGPTKVVAPKRLFVVGQLTLFNKTGRRFAITPDYRDLTPALDIIFAHLRARLRSDDNHEPFTFAEGSLEHRKGSLRYTEIANVELVLGSLSIRKHDGRKPWLVLGTHKVRNLFGFLDKLVARGVPVTNRDAFVPLVPTGQPAPEALPVARLVAG